MAQGLFEYLFIRVHASLLCLDAVRNHPSVHGSVKSVKSPFYCILLCLGIRSVFRGGQLE